MAASGEQTSAKALDPLVSLSKDSVIPELGFLLPTSPRFCRGKILLFCRAAGLRLFMKIKVFAAQQAYQLFTN